MMTITLGVDRTGQRCPRMTQWESVMKDIKVPTCSDRMHRFKTNEEGESEDEPHNPGPPGKRRLK